MHSIPINTKNNYDSTHFQLLCFYPDLCHATEYNSCCAYLCPFLCLMHRHSSARVAWSHSSDHGLVPVILHVVKCCQCPHSTEAPDDLPIFDLGSFHSWPCSLCASHPGSWLSSNMPSSLLPPIPCPYLSWDTVYLSYFPHVSVRSHCSEPFPELCILDLSLTSPVSILFPVVLSSSSGFSFKPPHCNVLLFLDMISRSHPEHQLNKDSDWGCFLHSVPSCQAWKRVPS